MTTCTRTSQIKGPPRGDQGCISLSNSRNHQFGLPSHHSQSPTVTPPQLQVQPQPLRARVTTHNRIWRTLLQNCLLLLTSHQVILKVQLFNRLQEQLSKASFPCRTTPQPLRRSSPGSSLLSSASQRSHHNLSDQMLGQKGDTCLPFNPPRARAQSARDDQEICPCYLPSRVHQNKSPVHRLVTFEKFPTRTIQQ